MPTTEFITLDASGSNSTTLNDAPSKKLSASVTASPSLVRSPIRVLAASAGSAVSIKRAATVVRLVTTTCVSTFSRTLTKKFTVVALGVTSVRKLVAHIFDSIGAAVTNFLEKHWGPRPFAVVNAENNWIFTQTQQWTTVSSNNWSITVLGD